MPSTTALSFARNPKTRQKGKDLYRETGRRTVSHPRLQDRIVATAGTGTPTAGVVLSHALPLLARVGRSRLSHSDDSVGALGHCVERASAGTCPNHTLHTLRSNLPSKLTVYRAHFHVTRRAANSPPTCHDPTGTSFQRRVSVGDRTGGSIYSPKRGFKRAPKRTSRFDIAALIYNFDIAPHTQ